MKRIITFVLLVAFIFINVYAVYAEDISRQNPIVVTLNDAIGRAISTSEDYKMSENLVEEMNSKYKEERAAYFTQIDGSATWKNNFEYPDNALNQLTKEYGLDMGITVNQKLFTFGKTFSSVAAAKKAIDVSRYYKDGTRQEIIFNAKIAYYNLYLARNILDIAEKSYENVKSNEGIIKERSADGRVSKRDNIKIKADIASRVPLVSNSRANYVSAVEALRVIIGEESKEDISLVEVLPEQYPELNREELALSLYNNQPNIKALSEAIKEKENLISAKKADFMPDISSFATWSHKGDSNDYYVGQEAMDDYGVWGLKVSVPIWTGGETGEKLQQARIDKRNADLEYQKGKESYLLELDKAIYSYREYKKTLEANIEAVHWAQESFLYSQELFRSGQISVTDLNDAEWQLTNEKINKETTLFNLNTTLAKIERLTLMGSKNE